MTQATNLSAGETPPPADRPPFEIAHSNLVEIQQRQIDAFARAGAIISSTVSAVISKQFDLLHKETEQFGDEMKLLFATRSPADVVPKQVAMVRSSFDQALTDLREISDLARNGTMELLDVFRDGIHQDMNPAPASTVEARPQHARPSRAA
jgi:phasin family protein